ncbi:MAG TPA: hypothetical protein VH560_19625 [Polyangia bacterium]|jgi:hypothetical protein|nr:hypothetical protein [Polyangia bacterium]
MRSGLTLAVVIGATSVAARPAVEGASYHVTAVRGGASLVVEATFGAGATFGVDRGAAAYVSDVEIVEPRGAGAVVRRGDDWMLPCARPCRVRYRFALARAADERDDVDLAGRQGASIVAPPSTWLLRPRAASPLPYALDVAGATFVTGLPRAPDGSFAGTFAAEDESPYAVFGAVRAAPIEGFPGLTFAVATPALDRDQPRIRAWVERAARAVSTYYGRFPVAHALVAVVQKDHGVHGKEMGGGGGASVLLEIAPGADLAAPSIEWEATHEIVHLAVPNMDRAHTWLTEGLATYVEPIARAQSGEIPASRVWRDALAGMPNGLPGKGDRGLDRTPTWGRTYWGGALFFLTADVEITRRSRGRQTLQTALRGALAAGADTTVDWTPERFFAAADRALGQAILLPQYLRWATTPVAVDLDDLWRRLGVGANQDEKDGVALDDRAPEAWVRSAVTRRP